MDGLKTTDVIIVGGGPAGMAAALWCDDLGLRSVLIDEHPRLGGQLHRIYNPIENYPGLSAANGIEMLAKFEASLASRNFISRTGIKALSIDTVSKEVRLNGLPGETWKGEAIILAMGVRRRVLGIPGESEFVGRGVLESGARDRESVKGKHVLIVGGGDAAFENAIQLSNYATSVAVAFRRDRPLARDEFVDAVKDRRNVELLPETVITEISGDSEVNGVVIRDRTGAARIIPVDAVLIRIGVEPNSELVKDLIELNEAGYIKVDHMGRTSAKDVYAAGDISNMHSPTLSTAIGTAVTAVKAISNSMTTRSGYNTV